MITNVFDRPLIDDERSLLLALATRVVADQTGCSPNEATAVLAVFVALGQLEIECDAQDAHVRANGNLIVHARRDWLSFHATHRGCNPMKDERRGATIDLSELGD
jgi:hypothetical protein